MPPVNNNEHNTNENFRLSEERERRFIDAYIKQLEAEGCTVVAQVAPVGSRAWADALLRITKDGRTWGEIIEVKVRSEKFSFEGLPSTYLTQSKATGLTKMRAKYPAARVQHVTFYHDGAVVHDLTTFIKQETELESERVPVKQRNSDPEGTRRYEWKFVLPHKGHTPLAAFSGQLFRSLY